MKTIARIAAVALAALPLGALAQMAGPRESEITVVGTGTISRPPDQASFGLSIVTNDDNAAKSTSKNNATYNAVRAELAAAGVAESAIKTVSYNVQYIPRPQKAPVNEFGQRYGYTTNRFLNVTTGVDGAGKAIDAAIAGGADNITNVSFGLKDRKAFYNEALAAAVADARSQADALAAAAGLHIVRVRMISSGYRQPPVMPAMRMQAAMAAPAIPTEIEPAGQIDVVATVTVSYQVQ